MLALATYTSGNFPMPVNKSYDKFQSVIDSYQDGQFLNYRLPNNTRPISYEVNLTTNVHTFSDLGFSGKVAVRFIVLEASRTITLHQRQLTIGETSLVLANRPDEPIVLDAHSYNNVNEFLNVSLATTDLIVNSEYILTIAYNGTHRTDKGFFYATYQNERGNDRYND